MNKTDLYLSNKINGILAEGILKYSRDFYHLAFFLTRNSENAQQNINDCISAGLFNARKIQTVPPVKTWFYQELIALCIKKYGEPQETLPKAYLSGNYLILNELDVQTRAVFALYYFEEISTERISKILRIKEPLVLQTLSYAAKQLGLTGNNKKKEEAVFEELTKGYKSVKVPRNYNKGIEDVIERERIQNEKHFIKDRRTKVIRGILGGIILVMIGYLIISGNIDNIFNMFSRR